MTKPYDATTKALIETDPNLAGNLATATYVLAGLRWSAAQIEHLLRRDPQMKASVTYQLLVAEGKAQGRAEGQAPGRTEEARRIGERRLGPASAAIRRQIEAQTDLEALEALADRIATAESWADALPMPK